MVEESVAIQQVFSVQGGRDVEGMINPKQHNFVSFEVQNCCSLIVGKICKQIDN